MQMLRYSSVTTWEEAAELIPYRSLFKGHVHSLRILSRFYITLHLFQVYQFIQSSEVTFTI